MLLEETIGVIGITPHTTSQPVTPRTTYAALPNGIWTASGMLFIAVAARSGDWPASAISSTNATETWTRYRSQIRSTVACLGIRAISDTELRSQSTARTYTWATTSTQKTQLWSKMLPSVWSVALMQY